IYHFDAYRLENPQAFEDLGVADYWGAGGVCLVEWADRVRGLLPDDCWLISIQQSGPVARRVRIEIPESAAVILERLAERLT
ncbi:MAG TPA: tRNA (adenosine(37)-N6)-threonylcarbamoyltransferase complex ATPase subunit type 1 TsaE, partial [Isosphaeraceae bacterium]|nr:tRNA (adenosine(37)-N6)-threonylcarbamoyltransferase complex ATPase subunit type 1 TsaE [Isosphaeraceae bacterium]